MEGVHELEMLSLPVREGTAYADRILLRKPIRKNVSHITPKWSGTILLHVQVLRS